MARRVKNTLPDAMSAPIRHHQNIYPTAKFGRAPFLSTLGNHDYSILADGTVNSAAVGSGANTSNLATLLQVQYQQVDSRCEIGTELFLMELPPAVVGRTHQLPALATSPA